MVNQNEHELTGKLAGEPGSLHGGLTPLYDNLAANLPFSASVSGPGVKPDSVEHVNLPKGTPAMAGAAARALLRTTLDIYALIDPNTNQRSGKTGYRLKQGTQVVMIPEDCPVKLVSVVEDGVVGSAQLSGSVKLFYAGPLDELGNVPEEFLDFDDRDINTVTWSGYERGTITAGCLMALADCGLAGFELIPRVVVPDPEPEPEDPPVEPTPDPEPVQP